MITTNAIQRVFRIYHKGKTASSYTIEKDNQQYLVSASHVFDEHTVNEISIYHANQWKKLPVKVVFNSWEYGDTIVFKLPHDISPRHPVSFGPAGVFLGSWSYFFGFPLGLMTRSGKINNDFPLPFVKAALVSSIGAAPHEVTEIFLDGHNNRGFSGGPVVWYQPNKSKDVSIIGTVSGYMIENPIASATQEEVDLIEINSGIIRAYWVKDLFDRIP